MQLGDAELRRRVSFTLRAADNDSAIDEFISRGAE
jgi:hypothetical protein